MKFDVIRFLKVLCLPIFAFVVPNSLDAQQSTRPDLAMYLNCSDCDHGWDTEIMEEYLRGALDTCYDFYDEADNAGDANALALKVVLRESSLTLTRKILSFQTTLFHLDIQLDRENLEAGEFIRELGSNFLRSLRESLSQIKGRDIANAKGCRDVEKVLTALEAEYSSLDSRLGYIASGIEKNVDAAPEISTLEEIDIPEVLEASRGQILLQIGAKFPEEALGYLARGLAYSNLRPFYAKGGEPSTIRVFFYGNEIPRNYSQSEIFTIHSTILALVEKYSDEISK